MAERTVVVRLVAAVGAYKAAMAQAAASTAAVGASAKTMGTNAAAGARGMAGLGSEAGMLNTKLLGAAGLAMGMKAVASAAIGWESAFADVRKTVEGTPQQLDAIGAGLKNMSTQIPTSANDLAAIAASAGQLGIETPNVLGFTRVIADLGETTNLAGEQGATQLARFANITQMSQGDFDRLGSTVVALGNNMATTEAEIVAMSMRLASAGSQAGMTEAEIMALAAAASSVGIEAEAGGTAFSRVIIKMRNAAMDGGADLDAFARTAGMTAEEFKRAFEQDAAGALVTFTEGLGRLEEQGGNSNQVLDELGLADIRVGNAMRAAASAGDLFRRSLEIGTAAWEENIALAEEAEKRYETTAAKLDIAKNAVTNLASELGASLLPAIGDTATALADTLGAELGTLGDRTLKVTDLMGYGLNNVLSVFGIRAGSAKDDVEELARAEDVAAEATAAMGVSFDDATVAASRTESAAGGLEGGLDELTTSVYRTEEGLLELNRMLDDLIGTHMSAEQAAINLMDGWDELTEALKENGSTLDMATEKGRANRQAVLDQADAIRSDIEARHNQGASLVEIAGLYDDHIGQLRGVMAQAGLTEDEIDSYIATLGLTPDEVVTALIAEDQSSSIIGNVISALGRIPRITETTIRTRHEQVGTPGSYRHSGGWAQTGTASRYHDGGQVMPLFGGLRHDEIPAILQHGEFVVRASVAEKHGPLLAALNAGRFHGGGPVDGGHSPSASVPSAQMPSTLVVVDADGTLIGRMRVEADGAVGAAFAGGRRLARAGG